MTSAEFRALRISLGLTQAELGEIMDMLPTNIARIESGDRQPTKIQAAFLRYISQQKKIQARQ